MDEEIPVPRFPILEFRIPNSVWHMEDLEYRTMRLRGRGAHMGAHGPGVTGWDTGCRRGDPGVLLANPGATQLAKEGGPKGDQRGTDTRKEAMAYS